jgi:predicted proteasome-type protease
MQPANTGKDNNNKNAVIRTDHTIKGNLCIDMPGDLILKIVVIKLIAPKIEDAPDKCKLKIAKSTAGPEWACTLLNGG